MPFGACCTCDLAQHQRLYLIINISAYTCSKVLERVSIYRELERGEGKQKASEVERGKVSYQRYELLGEESQ